MSKRVINQVRKRHNHLFEYIRNERFKTNLLQTMVLAVMAASTVAYLIDGHSYR